MVSEWYHVASGDDPRASLISSIRLKDGKKGEPTSGLEPLTCSSYE
jgi:hypothetical protein